MLKVIDRFPGANVKVIGINDKTREISFTSEPRGGTEVLWFDFRIHETEPASVDPVRITLHFFRTFLGAWNPAVCRPVIREQGKNWQRLKPPEVITAPDGQQTLSWIVPAPVNPVEIAFSFPYGRDELSTLLDHCKGYWNETPIGLSSGNRILTRLSNGILNGSSACPNPRGLYVVARQHGSEVTGSWVLDGMLEAFSRAKPVNWCVWAVPFANIDDASTGAFGKDPYPWDLNRAWGLLPMRREAAIIQQDIRAWSERCRPELVLDLHSPCASENDGVYTFTRKFEKPEAEKGSAAWINVFNQALMPDYAAGNFARKADYPSRWADGPTLAMFASNEIGCPSFSVETPYAQVRDTVLLQKQYREIGQKIARAIITRW